MEVMSDEPSRAKDSIRYTGRVNIGFGDRVFEFEMPSDATEKEVEEAAMDAAWNYIEVSYGPEQD